MHSSGNLIPSNCTLPGVAFIVVVGQIYVWPRLKVLTNNLLISLCYKPTTKNERCTNTSKKWQQWRK